MRYSEFKGPPWSSSSKRWRRSSSKPLKISKKWAFEPISGWKAHDFRLKTMVLRPRSELGGVPRSRRTAWKARFRQAHQVPLAFGAVDVTNCLVPSLWQPHLGLRSPETHAKRRLELDEARPECERVVLSKAFMVIFPTFARDAAMKYRNLGPLGHEIALRERLG